MKASIEIMAAWNIAWQMAAQRNGMAAAINNGDGSVYQHNNGSGIRYESSS
jgi:hypothetical protein